MAKAIDKARNWMNKNSAIASMAAIILLVVALGAVASNIFGGRGVPGPVDVYYYDLKTGELFTAKSSQFPPIHAPGSDGTGHPMGVRAYVYSCTDCSDESTRFVGYLEMYTPEAKKILENPPTMEDPDNLAAMDSFMMVEEEGHLVRAMDNEMWVLQMSEEGFMIMEDVQTQCGDGAIPHPCMPNM